MAMSKIRFSPAGMSSGISLRRWYSCWVSGGKRAAKVSGPRTSQQGLAEDLGLLPAEGLLEDAVPADDPAVLVEDGDADGQALDDVLAVVLEPLELRARRPAWL